MPEKKKNNLLDAGEAEVTQTFLRFSFIADAGQEPLRIDKFLVNRIEHATRNKVQAAIEKNQVLVNDLPVKSNYKVKPDDRIEVLVDKDPDQFEVIPENIPLQIVYEDDHILVVDKPAGMVVHPGVGNFRGTLLNALAFKLNVQARFKGKRPWLVHRIDKNTSGLLVVAKNDEAMAHLSRQFKKHTIERSYKALVWGNFNEEEKEGSISNFIGRDPYDRKRFTCYHEEDKGKWAVTHYKVLEDFMYTSLIECRLETGRTHQIRVHLKHAGHPLFNDERYGGHKILKGMVFSKYKQFVDNCFSILPRQALHAESLGFIHPQSGEKMLFHAPLPADFETVLERWRKANQSYRFE